jgi:hypothetical protein
MTAEIIKIQKKPSKYGGDFYYAFFKGLDGKNYYTCLYPKMRNFSRWSKILGTGVTLTNLRVVKKNPKLIDADSKFEVVGKPEAVWKGKKK